MKQINKRIYPSEEEPRYGKFFQVIGFQLKDLDGNYSTMVSATLVDKIFKVGATYEEWRKQKKKISDIILDMLDKSSRNGKALYREVCSLRARYLDDPELQIL